MRADLNPGIDDETRRAIEALSTEYSWLVDHGYADQAADLFTDDAVLSAGGSEVSGIAGIRRHLEERAQNRDIRSRHVVTNVRLRSESPDQVRGTTIMTIYRSIGESVRPQLIVGDVEDLYRLGADGRWRLAQRKLVPAFLINEL
ncbi:MULTISPECIES: SgcJ/EcaC family oxidoreductase [Mycobacterium]|uniref:SnoaL-like domain-containing protein n=2 Tax=Mycobacterium intracellulare TaxID=1767 RepID=X8CS71_MYCIT|nr:MULTISPECIES: SgcJ/EcaC family oxidoreductase [Mycobacterium]EUA58278.1 hypothetical protein I550_1418 [Mycobacterium intracellulare 1956]EUA26297.1 hypothetical protein I548_4397 [Mycobacterium intracellulare]MCA2356962.1 nuclear transport factor 2 family protein [Mycobacterium intracellulare]MCA2365377.1 nuclear transport factor 2 family protein [Mycobacterium intracellulare]UQB93864.1 nuclear transport factor 2 family protein [Mycobacterium intracellulare]